MIWEDPIPTLDDSQSTPERLDCGTAYDRAERKALGFIAAVVLAMAAILGFVAVYR